MEISRAAELLDNLKSEEIKKKVEAVSHLGELAKLIGGEKVKVQLIPFLKEFEDEEEEVLLALVKQLPELPKLLPNKEISIPELLVYFQLFLSYEDYSVANEVK